MAGRGPRRRDTFDRGHHPFAEQRAAAPANLRGWAANPSLPPRFRVRHQARDSRTTRVKYRFSWKGIRPPKRLRIRYFVPFACLHRALGGAFAHLAGRHRAVVARALGRLHRPLLLHGAGAAVRAAFGLSAISPISPILRALRVCLPPVAAPIVPAERTRPGRGGSRRAPCPPEVRRRQPRPPRQARRAEGICGGSGPFPSRYASLWFPCPSSFQFLRGGPDFKGSAVLGRLLCERTVKVPNVTPINKLGRVVDLIDFFRAGPRPFDEGFGAARPQS